MTETANIAKQISTLIKEVLDERKIPYTISPFDQTKAVSRAKDDIKGTWAKVKVEIESGEQKDTGANWFQILHRHNVFTLYLHRCCGKRGLIV